jgi:hypothetical protein
MEAQPMIGASSIGEFGHVWRDERGAWIFERVLATGSLVLKEIGGDRAGEVACNRFLKASEVTWEEIAETISEETAQRCAGRRIVVPQDTTDINLRGRDAGRIGFGPGSDGVGRGFFIHPCIAVDADDEAVLGVLDLKIWTRPEDGGAACKKRRSRTFEEKESIRWLEAAEAVAERVRNAEQIIMVGDRESDIYPLFARRPDGIDLIVRASQNRAVAGDGTLFEEMAGWPILATYDLKVPPRGPGDPGRIARVAVRAGLVEIKRPRNTADRDDPPSLQLSAVEVVEIDPPSGVEPIHWRLLSTLPVPDADAAKEIVRLYRLRWRIEQTFRALKNDGYRLPDVQIQHADRFFKLTAMAVAAAVRTIQLVDARDGSDRPASDVASPEVIQAAEHIGPTLERKTERQKNPHPPQSLAWLAWIIARLGGWNCYYKKPGPKTMRAGWTRLAAMAAGYHVAHSANSLLEDALRDLDWQLEFA